MSVIYDALKKVEKLGLKPVLNQGPVKKKPNFVIYLVYPLIILAGMVSAKFFFDLFVPASKGTSNQIATSAATVLKTAGPAPNITTPPLTTQAPENVAAAPRQETKVPPQSAYVLNGVFFSGNEGHALINNQISKIGETVETATVVNISMEGVELKTEDGLILKLSTRSR